MPAEFLFEDGGGFPLPLPYLAIDGTFREPDGVAVLSLEQAVFRFKMDPAELVGAWMKTWGTALPAPEGTQGGVRPMTPLPRGEALHEHVLRNLVCGHLSDELYAQFKAACEERGLSALHNQLHAETEWDAANKRLRLVVITHIDGFRSLAEGTGQYDGQDAPQWAGPDGAWVDVWPSATEPPFAARIPVYRKGNVRPFWGVAYWQMYAPYFETERGPALPEFWAKGGPHMLAKVAEALAFRRAFPERFAGVFTRDEMDQSRGRRNGARGPGAAERAERPAVIASGSAPSSVGLEPVDRTSLMLTLRDWGFRDDAARSAVLERCRREFGGKYGGEDDQDRFFGAVLRAVTGQPGKYGATPPMVS